MALKVENVELPKKYHDAVEHWHRHNFKDYELLLKYWDKYFPKDDQFCLCAKMELGTTDVIQIGDFKGQPKKLKPNEMTEEQAKHLLAIIKAQASTEFGSIQQHAGTVDRAPEDEDKFWTMRVMAEELRHGYQMLHLLLSEDWSSVSGGVTGEQMVEEILSMTTGSHVLDAFNLDYDSYTDNVVFAACIDRVGKYQLTMQKVCAYKPMADSMPPMLREEAFHLAAGVIPMRRWAQKAAQGDVFVTMKMMQHAVNKWLPRGMEMFGDERGGDTNVNFGFKDMKNDEASSMYHEEVRKMIRDINTRFIRARFPDYAPDKAEAVLDELERSRGTHQGLAWTDLLRTPDKRFFRRKGVHAFAMVGIDGEVFTDAEEYLRYLALNLNDGYIASRDMKLYAAALRSVASGQKTVAEAMKEMPRLKRVGGSCPCSKGVRWVMEDKDGDQTTVAVRN
ncbi:MAG: phenylacetate-CoA oxygenase subunit PaaI [Candidatus Eisenbacteria bacterium]|nr:phenylacetate-CoA oxygenase subunit PaaI [Candidatus Eisenbacteria bacterium]